MTTDTDKIEELAQTLETKGLCVILHPDETVNKQFWIEQAVFLRSLSAELAELRQAKESLDWLEKHTSLEAVILSTQISESDTPPVIPPYLKSRLEGIK